MTALQLRFGAFDFLLTPEGEWVFLEFTDRPKARPARPASLSHAA
jgi:hypothetical protein